LAAVPSTELLANFLGTDFPAQTNRFGSDQAAEPPDTQIAVGPNSVVEATNASLYVWSKTGAFISAADLNIMFFGPPPFAYAFSDPRVLYDAPSGRWFLTGLAFGMTTTTNASLLAVSTTSDPSGSWLTYGLATSTLLPDQPKLGVSADKLVISWNDFSGPTTFAGEETQVVQKSDLLVTTSAIRSVGFGGPASPDVNRFSPVPAIEQTPTNTEFVVYNRNSLMGNPFAGPYAGIARITGTPAAGNVVWDEVSIGIAKTGTPPNAIQQGSTTKIQTNDDRFLSADWRSNTLWVAGNDACTPSGDTTVRSCLRLVQVNATDTGATRLQDFDFGGVSVYAYFPAVATDSTGNLFVSFSGSGAMLTPSAEAISIPVVGSITAVLVAQGRGAYNSTACQGGANRWGDYSGAATDPSYPNDIWVASELAVPTMTNPCLWGTAIARLTLAPPTISGLSPFMGPMRGGTTVTITGAEYGLGDTTVSFAGTALASGVTLDSSQQVRAVSPANAACGSVPVTVTTSKGTSASATFTYVGWPCGASQASTSAQFPGRVPPPPVR
jgi:hypothetical protein